MRRNFDLNVMLFNNQIYGLTKGQYSPTSEKGQITKSTPYGSLEDPFNPAELAIGARATFVARTLDRDPKHMQAMIKRAQEHKGASFLEIYQNCPVFNDGTFFAYSDRETKKEHSLFLEHGKPLIFGENDDKAIRLDGLKPVVVNLADGGHDDLWIHDETDKTLAGLLARFHDFAGMPRPFGVIYTEDRPTYEVEMSRQLDRVEGQKGRLPLEKILSGEKTWEIH
jgi:2-oxoglutarate ferredoxin oxidoreductase subunit beta